MINNYGIFFHESSVNSQSHDILHGRQAFGREATAETWELSLLMNFSAAPDRGKEMVAICSAIIKTKHKRIDK